MSSKNAPISAVLVFLERKKTRTYVGKLTSNDEHGKVNFHFAYDKNYLQRKYAIPLGPDLPLIYEKFDSIKLFPAFQDRIPSKENPAYVDYCKEANISENEDNVIVLLSTIGKRGPSSFIFEPDFNKSFTANDLISYRKNLNLTIREFASLFDISASHLQRVESGKFPGKEILKIVEIYKRYPMIAVEEINKNSAGIHALKVRKVLDIIQNNIEAKKLKIPYGPGKWADTLSTAEVEKTLIIAKKLESVDWLKDFFNNPNIKKSISRVTEFQINIDKMEQEPKIQELDSKMIPLLIKTKNNKIWVYGRDLSEREQLHEINATQMEIDFKNTPKLLTYPMTPRPEIYFILSKYHSFLGKNEIINIKSSFFEIRFANAIFSEKLHAKYEYKMKDKKAVDFYIFGKKTANKYLVELASVRDSSAIKECTFESSDTFGFISEPGLTAREYIKIQNIILSKARKFSGIKKHEYNVVIIDMRGFLIGTNDSIDFAHLLYGGKTLATQDQVYFSDGSNNMNLIKGIFEIDFHDKAVLQKIHAIGFICEKDYSQNEIKTKTKLFINPFLITGESEKKLFSQLFNEW